MRFKIDENLPVEVAQVIRDSGYEADTVIDERLSGALDRDIAEVLRAEERVLVTLDVDFANLKRYPPSEYPGLVILRLRSQSKNSGLQAVRRVLSRLDHEPIAGLLWIVGENTIRVHD